MAKQDRGQTFQEGALALRAKTITLLRLAQEGNQRAVTNQPILERECLTPEGSALPQNQFANILLQDSSKTALSISDRIAAHILDTFALSVYTTELRASKSTLETSFGQLARQIALKPGSQARLDAQFAAYNEIADSVDAMNPLTDAKYDADFISQVSAMPKPLQKDDIAALDEIFTRTDDPEDVMFALFLTYLAYNPSATKPSNKLQEAVPATYRNGLIATAQSYMSAKFDQLVQARFAESPQEDIFPENASMLSVALAVQFARTTNALPQNYALLLEEDFIPGLTPETKALLVTYYQARFQQQQRKLASVPDDKGYLPYVHALESAENRTGIGYIRELVQAYTLPEGEQRSNIEWLKANFDPVRARLTSTRTIDGEEGVDAVDFYTYTVPTALPGNETIDMTVIADDYRAYTLQIDKDGHVIGLPKDIQHAGVAYVDHVLGKLRTSLEHKRAAEATPSRRPAFTPAASPRATSQPAQEAVTREMRMQLYTDALAQRQLKRRTLRRLGYLETTAAADEPVAAGKPTEEQQREFHIELIHGDTFIQQRDALPQSMRDRLDGILERVSHDAIYVQNYLKPLKEKDPRFQDLNAYSVRLGLDWRVVFVQMASGKMVVTSVEPRGRVYRNLQEDYAEMFRKLQSLQ